MNFAGGDPMDPSGTGQEPPPDPSQMIPFDDSAPPPDSTEQSFLWQQAHYMGTETGYHSGISTAQPSIAGQESLHGSLAGTIGTLNEEADLAFLTEQGDQGSDQQGPVHEGSRQPESYIPDFINVLRDDDPVIVVEALRRMTKIFQKPDFRRVLSQSPEIIECLRKALDHSLLNPGSSEAPQHDEATLNASNIFNSISKEDIGRSVILHHSGAIHHLIPHLGSRVDRLMLNAVMIMHNLLINEDSTKHAKQVMKTAQFPVIDALMNIVQNKSDNAKLMAVVADCLHVLAKQDKAVKRAIHAADGPAQFIRIMQNCRYEKLLLFISKLLKVLSVCPPEDKRQIIDANGMKVLAHLCATRGQGGDRVVLNCALTLRNLSDVQEIMTPDEAANMVMILNHPDEEVRICGAGILFNMTCNKEANKREVFRANGIGSLVQNLLNVVSSRVIDVNNSKVKDLIEPTIGALSHLSNGHQEAGTVQEILGQEPLSPHDPPSTLQIIRTIYERTQHRGVLKVILILIRYLAINPANWDQLRKYQYPQQTVHILRKSCEMFQTQREDKDEVRLHKLIELTLATFTNFARDPENKPFLCDPQLVDLLIDLLGFPSNINVNVQKNVTSILDVLATGESIQGLLSRPGVDERILAQVRPLTNSQNDVTAQNSGRIIQKIFNFKESSSNWSQQQPWNNGSGSMQQQQQQFPPMMNPGGMQPPMQQQQPQPNQGGGFDFINTLPMDSFDSFDPPPGGFLGGDQMGGMNFDMQ